MQRQAAVLAGRVLVPLLADEEDVVDRAPLARPVAAVVHVGKARVDAAPLDRLLRIARAAPVGAEAVGVDDLDGLGGHQRLIPATARSATNFSDVTCWGLST